MKIFLKKFFEIFRYPIDISLSILVVPGAYLLLAFRRIGAKHLPRTNKRLKKIGVYPIRNHYYEPLFNDEYLIKSLDENRILPGVDLNVERQLEFLNSLKYSSELILLNLTARTKTMSDFYLSNGFFEYGDAEILYQIIRKLKPNKIIEIGSGNSTKIARLAIKRNELETGNRTVHICIEPFEQPWLMEIPGITLIRERVEKLNIDWSSELSGNDLLFVDSSHMIRPQGDVLTEYLQIFPKLAVGVYVHVHDIFTPKDYLKTWIVDSVLFWNEQYLLEALLTNTNRYEIVAALNYLKHHHYDALLKVCPYLKKEHEPRSFYFKVCSKLT